jgi:hypothetical protein
MKIIITTLNIGKYTDKWSIKDEPSVLFFFKEESKTLHLRDWNLIDCPFNTSGFRSILTYLYNEGLIVSIVPGSRSCELTPEGEFRVKLLLVNGFAVFRI